MWQYRVQNGIRRPLKARGSVCGNKGVQNGIRRQLKARDPVCGNIEVQNGIRRQVKARGPVCGNIGVQNGIRRQLKSRGPVCGPTGPFLYSQHSKLKIIDIGQPFVTFLALQAPIQESHDHLMVPKCHSRLTQGLRKAATCTETRLVT